MDHLIDCIIGVRPEMLTAGECFGGCACECHMLWADCGCLSVECHRELWANKEEPKRASEQMFWGAFLPKIEHMFFR